MQIYEDLNVNAGRLKFKFMKTYMQMQEDLNANLWRLKCKYRKNHLLVHITAYDIDNNIVLAFQVGLHFYEID